ncbi:MULTISPECIES: FtsX-like permease family protein [unclassified Staphylococcus]|uniref:FtsX-like permease family protein n=1 Tax=unclassified Staphylococcus TaxID=91994 RepID=UPI00187F13CF|nr:MULTISPECIES: FtsX-like permease family protein [unclassified Staphylococcus]MBF2758154.1 ABC transporter permease [Staphylococcus haemolyticus]MBF2773834.1 ABC transporter permease [Staphylococcus haemolyticus]MBF2776413.1 ABC transporter permease [Staphylococcus haemolyticus]MBF2816003.1 ABC transporter permease [Staphylococcus haemolyticus]MBF9719277.1 ABC transporter permease [Staphylococcus haemolyticus]
MTIHLLWKMIAQNFKMQRHVIMPFILALGIMFAAEFILLSLNMNTYVQQRSQLLPIFIGIGNFFMSVLGFIFILYANRFIMKRRQQELAMNMILGMEKKHFRLIMLIEMLYQYIFIALISIIGGYLFGVLIFMLMNKLMHQTGMSVMDYPFNVKAMLITLALLAAVMLLLFFINNVKIMFQSPIKLISQRQRSERKLPQFVLYSLLVIGIITLFNSYHIALSNQMVLRSLYNLFGAIGLVMIGTYCLYLSLGILLLDWLKRIPSLYYNPKYFFTISGLQSRMNSNAIGLASITMLCTFLIVTVGMTISTYRGISNQVDVIISDQYRVSINGNIHNNPKTQEKVRHLERDIKAHAKVDFFKKNAVSLIAVDYQQPGLFKHRNNKDYSLTINGTYLVIMTQHDYNTLNTQKVKLKQDELGFESLNQPFKKLSTATMMGDRFKIKHINGHNYSYPVPGALTVITPDNKTYQQLTNYYVNADKNDHHGTNSVQNTFLHFNIMTKQTADFDRIKHTLMKRYDVYIDNKKDVAATLYEINGGLIFIGTVVSIILFIGTFLMMYYKNVAEGYEDRKNYQIMQQVGIDKARIKATINKQIIWIFALPIIVATMHVIFASKIIFNVLGILNVNRIGVFVTSYVGVIISIVVIYALMYWITSRIYYMIVNRYH